MNDMVRAEQAISAIQRYEFGRTVAAQDIRTRVNVIQDVMQAVMKKDVHYGVIPGCQKPSLYKPGSEILLATFQIATSILVTDLSTEDTVRYQVRVVGTHQGSGVVVGEGIGECSSGEEKYKWRRAFSKAEFDAASENRRRVKYGKDYTVNQIRTESADLANTILKMAKKRAQIDMTLTALGASDCFEQDVEDLPEELLERDNRRQAGDQAPPLKEPVSKSAQKQDAGSSPAATQSTAKAATESKGEAVKASPGAIKMIQMKSAAVGVTDEQVLKQFSITDLTAIDMNKVNEILAWLKTQAAA